MSGHIHGLFFFFFLLWFPMTKSQTYTLIQSEFTNYPFPGSEIHGWMTNDVALTALVSDCGSYHLFGGYLVFSGNYLFYKNFTNLIPHYQLKITLTSVKIDGWYSDYIEYGIGPLPSSTRTVVAKRTYDATTVQSNICGLATGEYVDPITLEFAHSDSSVIFGWQTNSVGLLEYYGITNLNIYGYLCDFTCLTCSGSLSNNCLTCYPNATHISTNECPCWSLYYRPTMNSTCTDPPCSLCLPCDPNCNQCTGPLNTDCIACNTLIYGNQCVSSCPANSQISPTNSSLCVGVCTSNQYMIVSNSTCGACDASCLGCTGPTSSQCTDCPSFHFLSSGSCLSCDSSCKTCNGIYLNNCTSCLGSNLLQTGSCVSSCSIGYYSNGAGSCLKCNSSCISCQGSASNCFSCTNSLFLLNGVCYQQCTSPYWGMTSNMSCVQNCGSSYFGDGTDRICKACDSSCSSCNGSSSSSCTSCNSSFFLQNGYCVSSCSIGYYSNGSGTCYKCDPSCLNCTGPLASNCLSCFLSTYFFLNGTCNQKCLSPYWGITSNMTCAQNCETSYFGDNTDRLCKVCDSSCKTCIYSAKNCTSCNSPLLLQNGVCVSSCSSGYYSNNSGECYKCDPSCLSCSGPLVSNCLSCSVSLFLLNGMCNQQCPYPYWGITTNMTCVSNCATSYFGDTSNRICKTCDVSCKTCNGITSFNCTSCVSSLILFQSSCVTSCPTGYFSNISGLCYPCDSSCLSCTGPLASNCLSCSNNTSYLENSVCVQVCNSNLFPRGDTHTCVGCSVENCLECEQWNICKTCFDNYSLNTMKNCLQNIYTIGNLTKQGEENLFYLTFDRNLTISSQELSSFISLSFLRRVLQTQTPYTYTFEVINHHNFSILFSFTSNLTKETEFEVELNENFLVSKYPNYRLNQTTFSGSLSPVLVCPNNYMSQESSSSCISLEVLNPQLALTFNPVQINLKMICISETCVETEEYKENLFKHIEENHVLKIQPEPSAFKDYNLELAESEDPAIILIAIKLNYEASVVGNYKLIFSFTETETASYKINKNQVSIKLMDYYLLDESTEAQMNGTVRISTSGSLASQISMYLNSFLQSDSSFAFRTIMIIEYIYILRYININYPINAIEMFRNKIEPSKIFLKHKIETEKYEKDMMEGVLELYEMNPYFLNNFGELIINFSIIFFASHIFNILYIKLSPKVYLKKNLFTTIMKPLYETIVWSISIIYLSSNYLNLCYCSALNLVYPPIHSSMGILNFAFGIFSFFISAFVIIYFFIIIGIIRMNLNLEKSSEIKSDEKIAKVFPEPTPPKDCETQSVSDLHSKSQLEGGSKFFPDQTSVGSKVIPEQISTSKKKISNSVNINWRFEDSPREKDDFPSQGSINSKNNFEEAKTTTDFTSNWKRNLSVPLRPQSLLSAIEESLSEYNYGLENSKLKSPEHFKKSDLEKNDTPLKNHSLELNFTFERNHSPEKNQSPEKNIEKNYSLEKNQNEENNSPEKNNSPEIRKKKSKFGKDNQPWDESPKKKKENRENMQKLNEEHDRTLFFASNQNSAFIMENNSPDEAKKNRKESTKKDKKKWKDYLLVHDLENLIGRYDVLYNDFKQNTKLSHILVIFDLTRYFLIAMLVAFFEHYFLHVLSTLLILNSLFCLYLIIYFPFKEKIKNGLTLITELANVLATCGALTIAICDKNEIYDAQLRLNAGWMIVYANIILIFLLLLTFMITLIQILCKACKKKKTDTNITDISKQNSKEESHDKKKKVYPEPDNDRKKENLEKTFSPKKKDTKILISNKYSNIISPMISAKENKEQAVILSESQ